MNPPLYWPEEDVMTVLTEKRPKVTDAELRDGRVTVRFAGDSGDGIQLLGGLFAKSTATNMHDLVTFSDFPAEIRAPAGTLFGVSAFQIQFGGPMILTVGDEVDVLVVFNPAALKTNLASLRRGGMIVADKDGFTDRDLAKAGYDSNPLADDSLGDYRVLEVDITRMAREVGMEHGVSKKEADRTKNFWALGLTFWMFGRERAATRSWIQSKFAKIENVAAANAAAFDAGHAFGETIELSGYHVPKAKAANFPDGQYRSVTGIETLVYGLAAAALAADRELCFCSYPITPASGILHGLVKLPEGTVHTFQAEDEISAACAAIGAAYAGAIGVTASSGPGIALKAEALGLAVATELPLVVINVQRAGPSTGMPTKTEQADLELALYGRHGEAPMIVLAPATPSECFEMAVDAVRLAAKYMTPVMLLADGYIVNAAEPWRIPDVSAIAPITAPLPEKPEGDARYQPFQRDPKTLARAWAVPGMEGLEHRIGGLERSDGAGNISYDPDNHQHMTDLRADKVAMSARDIPPAKVERGSDKGRIAVVGWGSTYGPIDAAINELIMQGADVAHIHIRHLSPLPKGLEELLRAFDKVLVVEMNTGQLRRVLRSEFLIPAEGLNQVTGRPFTVTRIKRAVLAMLED